MKDESDGDTSCNWCTQYSHQRIGTGTEGLGNKKMSGDHPNYSIIKIGQNAEKSPGDEERCYRSNSNKKLPANVGVKISKRSKIIKVLHPRDDINRLYEPRKEWRKGLASIGYSVDASIQGLENYIKMSKERLITVTRSSTDNIKINRTSISWKQKRKEKQLYGYFKLMKTHMRRSEHG